MEVKASSAEVVWFHLTLRETKVTCWPFSSATKVSIISRPFFTLSCASAVNCRRETSFNTFTLAILKSEQTVRRSQVRLACTLNRPWPNLSRSDVVRLLPSRKKYCDWKDDKAKYLQGYFCADDDEIHTRKIKGNAPLWVLCTGLACQCRVKDML